MTRVACPCCRRELVARVDWYDDEPDVHLVAVELRDQPCSYGPGAFSVRLPFIGWVRGVERGNAVCNWLLNDPSHVTLCYAVRWCGRSREERYNRRHQSHEVARCLQHEQA